MEDGRRGGREDGGGGRGRTGEDVIQKGQRNEVIGYKPQVGRSKEGFITCITVPECNAADSGQLETMVYQHIARTGLIPDIVSTDDGYASSDGKRNVELKGVGVVMIEIRRRKKESENTAIDPQQDGLAA